MSQESLAYLREQFAAVPNLEYAIFLNARIDEFLDAYELILPWGIIDAPTLAAVGKRMNELSRELGYELGQERGCSDTLIHLTTKMFRDGAGHLEKLSHANHLKDERIDASIGNIRLRSHKTLRLEMPGTA